MKLTLKLVTIAVVAAFAGAAAAQSGSTSQVTVDKINQSQSGLLNDQKMNVGNAK